MVELTKAQRKLLKRVRDAGDAGLLPSWSSKLMAQCEELRDLGLVHLRPWIRKWYVATITPAGVAALEGSDAVG